MNRLSRHIIISALSFRVFTPKFINKSIHTFECNGKLDGILSSNKLSCQGIYYSSNRWKSKKVDVESDDEDGVFDDDASLAKDSKVVKFNTQSLRTDQILKSALAVSRNKIEEKFYESKIRINGKKVLKKSLSVKVGDEIDVIKMVSPKNPDHLYVARIEILNLAAKEDSISVSVRRFKNLLIENYEVDPFKGTTETN